MHRHPQSVLKLAKDFHYTNDSNSSKPDGMPAESVMLLNGNLNGEIPNHPIKSVTIQETVSGHSTDGSLGNPRTLALMLVWYIFSLTTLFLNKYILSYNNGDPTALGAFQLLMCSVCGYIHMRFPCGLYKRSLKESRPSFGRNVIAVGTLRFTTVLLGLVALWYVPVSFAETVKSSAPVFTVVISRFVTGEVTSWLVNVSLLPVMGGLALCSMHEVRFSTAGFIASLATNLSECFQNVFSKLLLSGEKLKYEAPELQFYTSIASIGIQIPACLLLIDGQHFFASLDKPLLLAFFIDGLSFHCQSLTEYMLLGRISPVTHSVANTLKRALLIWLSVITFGNPVTFLGGLGIILVLGGAAFYNKAHEISKRGPVPVLGASGGHHEV